MDLLLSVDPNPNCDSVDGMMYQALEPPRPVAQMRVSRAGREVLCWVTGVEPPAPPGGAPRWVPAQARKITDSGAGVAYVIYGGRWGLRFQPASAGRPAWDLQAAGQWGEPYKIYGDTLDLVF